MPDYAAGILNLLQNGPGPLPPEQEAKVNEWLLHKQGTYAAGGATPEQQEKWFNLDNERYRQHFNELATHAAAANAVDRSKTMLIGLLGLSGQANKLSAGDRSAAAYWSEARRNGQVPAGEAGPKAPPWKGVSSTLDGNRSAAAYWAEARRNGLVPAGEEGPKAPPWTGR